MDPEYSLQDLVRCHLCETPSGPGYCDICDVHLCEDCEEKHFADESKDQKLLLDKKEKDRRFKIMILIVSFIVGFLLLCFMVWFFSYMRESPWLRNTE